MSDTDQPVRDLSPAAIVRRVVESPETDIPPDNEIYLELKALALYIRRAKGEVAAIQPHDIQKTHIVSATDELDAVVGATEEATNKIMDVCDEIAALATACEPEAAQRLAACTTRIFEACNFQDITGQRIAKVVNALKHIDGKIAALIKAFDVAAAGSPPAEEINGEEKLLNGPQLPKNAIDQNAVDRLFSEV